MTVIPMRLLRRNKLSKFPAGTNTTTNVPRNDYKTGEIASSPSGSCQSVGFWFVQGFY